MPEDDLTAARRAKVDALVQQGRSAYAVRFDVTHRSAELQEAHGSLEAGANSGQAVRVAGRVLASRVQGKVAFGDLVDATGKIQLFVTGDLVAVFDELDDGDIVGASGEVVRTKRGELSVRVDGLDLLAKALRPPPAKWHGLKDVETRFRQRYLDLQANPDARRIAALRVDTIRATRAYFDERGFMEVETPILQQVLGGATARPFVTHHNALDTDLYLRVAPELHLKRLLVGGLERVYEIGRVFRNEGLGYRWNPEFTMLEAYQAYADYTDMMALIEELFVTVATATTGSAVVSFEGSDIDLGAPWERLPMCEAVSRAVGEAVDTHSPADTLRDLCARHDVEIQDWWGPGHLINELYEKLVEPNIVGPTLICDYPVEVSPLARLHRDDPTLTERFEPIVAGRELGNAFSELNDPIDQRRRFEAQMQAREHGDVEAMEMDEAYVEALEYGMPPAGGLGVGIDRLVMMLAGVHSIKEVILFPALRPPGSGADTQV